MRSFRCRDMSSGSSATWMGSLTKSYELLVSVYIFVSRRWKGRDRPNSESMGASRGRSEVGEDRCDERTRRGSGRMLYIYICWKHNNNRLHFCVGRGSKGPSLHLDAYRNSTNVVAWMGISRTRLDWLQVAGPASIISSLVLPLVTCRSKQKPPFENAS